MLYKSTRSQSKSEFTSAQVIKNGLANDGGLFMPDHIPQISSEFINKLCNMSYPERAATVLSMFLTDYTFDELFEDCTAAYNNASFPGGAAPIVDITPRIKSLELWHGPTAAFKDMALQIMPRLLSRALVKTGEKRTAYILVATSGDTGKAALEGYKDISQTKITVFYPVNGVSRVQKLQMTTQLGKNVNVCAINGNFDDAQSAVKKVFADSEIASILNRNNCFFSSANSINWGRLAPQIVYYISAYCDLINSKDIATGDLINICVPTGNFGNIFAAYIAKCAGLPIGKLICASNSNNVLTDFISSGVYDKNRNFHLTMSPSMDILISSNLERLLYLIAGPKKTAQYMDELATNGKYIVDTDTMAKIKETFIGYFTDEEQTEKTIFNTFNNNNYLCDTHTAVAVNCAQKYINDTGDHTVMVVASTASPYKFAKDVYRSLSGNSVDDIVALDELYKLTKVSIPYPLSDISSRQIRFNTVIEKQDIQKFVIENIN